MDRSIKIKRLERYLTDRPNDPKAHFELGMLYALDGNYRSAILEIEKSLVLQPDNIKAHFELGLIYSKTGQYEQAIRQWQKMKDEEGDLILSHIKDVNPTHIMPAIRAWDHFRESTTPPDSPIKSFTLGFANMILGRFDRAILDFTDALEGNPRLEKANFYRGLCRLQKKEHKKAASDFLAELTIRPRNYQCVYHLGMAYKEMGHLQQAIIQFERAIKENPRYLKALFQLGSTYSAQGNYPKAIKSLEKVLEYNPRYVQAYFELGKIYEKQFQLDKAVDQYELAVHLNPDHKEANFHLGLLYKNLGKHESALEYLKRTIQLDPSEGDAYYYMGLIHMNRGDYKEATSCFEKALEVMPRHSYARYSLGLSYFKMDKIGEAIEEYKKALELNPRDIQTHNALGLAYLKLENFEKATHHFEEVLKINPKDIYAFYNLGAVNFHTEDFDKATQFFSKVLELDSHSPYAPLVRGAKFVLEGNLADAFFEFHKRIMETSPEEKDIPIHATTQLLATSLLKLGIEKEEMARAEIREKNQAEGLAELFLYLMDAKIPAHRGHSKRVAEISAVIAEALDFTEEEIQDLYIASLLHDVGKLFIDEKILKLSPAQITKEHQRILMSHPKMGYKMLKEIEAFKYIASVVLYHHERYDGKGYPVGLAGDNIPVESQIISIADYWDNLIHKKSMSPAKALDHILSLRNKKFSSLMVDTIMGVIDQILLI